MQKQVNHSYVETLGNIYFSPSCDLACHVWTTYVTFRSSTTSRLRIIETDGYDGILRRTSFFASQYSIGAYRAAEYIFYDLKLIIFPFH